MDHTALAHAAAKVAIGCGHTNFTFSQNTVAHAQTGAAGGIGNAKTGIHERFDNTFVQSLFIDLGRSR